MTQQGIGFIGGGNMATALVHGLRDAGWDGDRICVSDPDPARLAAFRGLGVRTTTDNGELVQGSDVVILAVKPQVISAVAEGVTERISENTVLVSIAAGVSLEVLKKRFSGHARVYRVMPNTGVGVSAGACGLCGSDLAPAEDLELVASIFRTVGIVEVVSETQIDAVTALSGSGPAYFFRIVEHFTEAAADMGLPRDVAYRLARQTMYGAARLLRESGKDAATLRREVTSPGGTTAAGLDALDRNGLHELLQRTLHAARDRAEELTG